MLNASALMSMLMDSLTEQIAVIDEAATIVYVNKAWRDFSQANGGPADTPWIGQNYLQACGENPSEPGPGSVALAIRHVLQGRLGSYQCDYPCDTPTQQRWFMMRVGRLQGEGPPLFVVSHTDITVRWNAEDEVRRLARTDPLTGLANRRHLDEFLHAEIQRSVRAVTPISIAVLDLDYFKSFNDAFGHPKGDHCLAAVGSLVGRYARRPSDLAARFGGEEFVLVLGGAPGKEALHILENLRAEVSQLHLRQGLARAVTISGGMVTAVPDSRASAADLINIADLALYRAKQAGRDRIEAVHHGEHRPSAPARSAQLAC